MHIRTHQEILREYNLDKPITNKTQVELRFECYQIRASRYTLQKMFASMAPMHSLSAAIIVQPMAAPSGQIFNLKNSYGHLLSGSL